MIDFQYVFFDIPSQNDVVQAFPDREPDFMAEAYRKWLKAHCKRAELFYRAQYRNHETLVWNAFCDFHGISKEESISYQSDEINALWKEEDESSGLMLHWLYRDHALDSVQQAYEEYFSSEPVWTTSDHVSHTVKKILQEAEMGQAHPSWMRRYIDEWWFNTTINNSEAMAKELRRMPYKDYLQSLHWRRVKGALMIIHCARCMSDQCCGLDGYWNDDRFLHVHHMSYKNRGNERFEDLRLLCHMCHKRFHKHGIEAVFSHPQVPYSVMQ